MRDVESSAKPYIYGDKLAKEKEQDMQVKVNCKKKPVDFSSGDFRSTVRTRYGAKKTFDAEYRTEPSGDIVLDRDNGKQMFPITSDNVRSLTFFIDGDRSYVEAVTDTNNATSYSFLIAPVQTVVEMGQQGVIDFRESLDALSEASGVEVAEVIDPNPVGLCPDGFDDMESLIEERLIEGADIIYTGLTGTDSTPTSVQSEESGADDVFIDEDIDPFTDYQPPVEDILPAFNASPTLGDGFAAVAAQEDDGFTDEENIEDGEWEDVLGELHSFASALDDDYDDPYGNEDDTAAPAFDTVTDNDGDTNDADDTDDANALGIDSDKLMELFEDDEDTIVTATADIADEDAATDDNKYDENNEQAQDVAASDEMEDDEDMKIQEHIKANAKKNEVEEAKASAVSAMGGAYDALLEIQASLRKNKEERVAAVRRLSEEFGGDYTEIVPENAPSVTNDATDITAPSAPPAIDATRPVIDIDSDDPNEVADALRNEMEILDESARAIDVELDDYDNIINESKKQQDEFLKNLDSMGDHDAVVAGLISLYQEQTEYTEQMNVLLKKEQVLKHHAIDQRDSAYKTIADQKNELDKLRRSLRFSEQSKRKSEQFIKDAKKEIHLTIQKARARVEESVKACERMQAQVDAAEARVLAADERRSAAELARVEACKERDEAVATLEEEKQHTKTIIEAFDNQLDEFTRDTMDKIQDQIDRANTAEKTVAEANQKISDLESALAETKTRLMAFESKCSKKDVDIANLRKLLDEAEAAAGDLALQRNAAAEECKETGQVLNETETQLVKARAEVKKLEEELAQAKTDRDNAIAERLAAVKNITDQSNTKVRVAATERDEAVANVVGAKDDAIAANQRFIAAMTSAMQMDGGFGSRKRKLDAIAEAYNAFVANTQAAEIRGDVPMSTVENAVMDMVADYEDDEDIDH